jgi:hypothetical protein
VPVHCTFLHTFLTLLAPSNLLAFQPSRLPTFSPSNLLAFQPSRLLHLARPSHGSYVPTPAVLSITSPQGRALKLLTFPYLLCYQSPHLVVTFSIFTSWAPSQLLTPAVLPIRAGILSPGTSLTWNLSHLEPLSPGVSLTQAFLVALTTHRDKMDRRRLTAGQRMAK